MNVEQYPNLQNAPIVEAVIHWQADPGEKLEQDGLEKELRVRLPEYPKRESQQEVEASASGGPGSAPEFEHRAKWNGFRLGRDDKPFVAQFTPSSVIFSWLAPYESWKSFEAEGLKLWDVFAELAEPVLIRRLGVRFINRIPMGNDDRAGDLLCGSPDICIQDVTHESFFYKDTLLVPNSPYQVNWVRTIQSSPFGSEKAIIVDIDVAAPELSANDNHGMRHHLARMRAIKNSIFFGCITPQALGRFEKHDSRNRVQ